MSTSRGNIVVKFPNKQLVYLYTAKDGQRLPKLLKRALIRGRKSWGDTATLTRIIFSELTQQEPLGLNGYAIGPTLMDNDHYILAIDDKEELIGAFSESGQRRMVLTFDEFINQYEEDLEWNILLRNFRFSREALAPMPPNFNYPMSDF